MSSVPVQLLIYVMPQQTCGLAPVIFPLQRCFDAQVNVSISFNISALTLCDPTVSDIDTFVVTNAIAGMNLTDTIASTINSSVSYITFTWRPTTSQIGPQLYYVSLFFQSKSFSTLLHIVIQKLFPFIIVNNYNLRSIVLHST